jgi:hypothetical protein
LLAEGDAEPRVGAGRVPAAVGDGALGDDVGIVRAGQEGRGGRVEEGLVVRSGAVEE